jgi:hypothetical protein
MNKLETNALNAAMCIIAAFVVKFIIAAIDFGVLPWGSLGDVAFDILFGVFCTLYIIFFIRDVIAYLRLNNSKKRFESAPRKVLYWVCLAFLIFSVYASLAHVTLPVRINDVINLFWFAALSLHSLLIYNDYHTVNQQRMNSQPLQ